MVNLDQIKIKETRSEESERWCLEIVKNSKVHSTWTSGRVREKSRVREIFRNQEVRIHERFVKNRTIEKKKTKCKYFGRIG